MVRSTKSHFCGYVLSVAAVDADEDDVGLWLKVFGPIHFTLIHRFLPHVHMPLLN